MQTEQLFISVRFHKLAGIMLSAHDIDIFSSFGPLGRSKVIENVHGGSRVVTKDGQQILDCCLSDPRSQNYLQRTLLKMCCSVSEEYGDGSLTTLLIASHIISRLGILAKGDSNLCSQWVLLLKAVETICSAVDLRPPRIGFHTWPPSHFNSLFHFPTFFLSAGAPPSRGWRRVGRPDRV